MGQCSALRDISLVASIYVILFLFPCFSTIIYLIQTLSKKFDKSPVVPRNSCVSMVYSDSGPRTAPRAHHVLALHRSAPVPTVQSPMSSLTTLYRFSPPPLAKGWFLVAYPFLRQHCESSTSRTLQKSKAGIVLQNVQRSRFLSPIQDCRF